MRAGSGVRAGSGERGRQVRSKGGVELEREVLIEVGASE